MKPHTHTMSRKSGYFVNDITKSNALVYYLTSNIVLYKHEFLTRLIYIAKYTQNTSLVLYKIEIKG